MQASFTAQCPRCEEEHATSTAVAMAAWEVLHTVTCPILTGQFSKTGQANIIAAARKDLIPILAEVEQLKTLMKHYDDVVSTLARQVNEQKDLASRLADALKDLAYMNCPDSPCPCQHLIALAAYEAQKEITP